MNDYKVDIRFPDRDSDDADLVQITGAEQNVLDCKDDLLNRAEEYMQDIRDDELMRKYERPARDHAATNGGPHGGRGRRNDGFVVANAPWHINGGTPDVSSTQDFPDLGAQKAKKVPVWGPQHKR